MRESVLSENWYRVQALHPRLRSHVSAQRRVFRGGVWYVLRDASTGRHHRVSEIAYHIVGRLTGEHSMRRIWEQSLAQLGERVPTQDEVIRLLGALHENHLLQSEATPDIDEMFARQDANKRKRRSARVNPLSFRVSLWDPTAFLDRWVNLARPLYTWSALWVLLLILTIATLSLIPHWNEIQHYGARLLETRYLMLMALCYPPIKILHELAHAFAVRIWGGEVREMGVSLILLLPIPYVDASAASSFKQRHRRVAVGAAGIMMEMLIAALGGLLWLNCEPGLMRDVAFATLAIGGLSTLLFNGNPLLRLDGYYVLCDSLEIPNLAARGNASALELIQRRVLGVKRPRSNDEDGFERNFLPAYALASNAYRLAVSCVIAMWVAAKSLVLAIFLAVWMLHAQLIRPCCVGLKYLMVSPALMRVRLRAITTTFLLCALVMALIFVVPLRSTSYALGVVWFAEQTQIRAATAGFVKRVHHHDSTRVGAHVPIIELFNPEIEARIEVMQARVRMMQVRVRNAMRESPTDLQAAVHELNAREAELEEIRRQATNQLIFSRAAGRLVLPRANDLPGSFIKQGTTLGHVVTDEDMVIRVAVPQEQAGRVREARGVSVRLAESPDFVHRARMLREVPAAENELHSAALGDRGGGLIRTDPSDLDGTRTQTPIFVFDVAVLGVKSERVGGRAHVLFRHADETLSARWGRTLRQLFLRQAAA